MGIGVSKGGEMSQAGAGDEWQSLPAELGTDCNVALPPATRSQRHPLHPRQVLATPLQVSGGQASGDQARGSGLRHRLPFPPC